MYVMNDTSGFKFDTPRLEMLVTCIGVGFGRKIGIAYALHDAGYMSLYALAFWYGNRLVRDGEIQLGDIMIAMFGALFGVMGFSQVGSYAEVASKARVAAFGMRMPRGICMGYYVSRV